MADSRLPSHSEASEADPGSSSSPGIGALIQSGFDWFDRELWERDPESTVFVRALRSTAQLIALTVNGFQTDQLRFIVNKYSGAQTHALADFQAMLAGNGLVFFIDFPAGHEYQISGQQFTRLAIQQ